MRLIGRDDGIAKYSHKGGFVNNLNPQTGKPKFTESYIKLCMTKEVKQEFVAPQKGNWVVEIENPKNLMCVSDGSGPYVYTKERPTAFLPPEVAWIPTIKEILDVFFIEIGDGYYNEYSHLINAPEDFGYTKEELTNRSEEEKWLFLFMRLKRYMLLKNGEWIKINKN
jgi:hypothetical protein